ncbi:MAG: 6-phosphogluconolactonase [Theionarchaea archaeon]|nr:6-phosphogluconolactonase [Theionarchaea archaeon]
MSAMVESLSGVYLHETQASLYDAAAQMVILAARRTISDRGKFALALSGGTTPEPLYRTLADSPINWTAVELYMVDERFVGLDHPESNFGMVWNILVKKVPIPAGQVFPIPTELSSSMESAEAYDEILQESMGSDPWPGFDLIVLGMGSDGHTASLFPGNPEIESTDLVVATNAPAGYLTSQRVTITLRAINSSRDVIFLVTGRDKKSAVESILGGNSELPAARIRPRGDVRWLLTRDVLA